MKFFRGFGIVVVSIITILAIISVSILYISKNIIKEQVLVESVKNFVLDEAKNKEVDTKKIETIIKDKEVSNLIDSALSDYVKYVNKESNGISIETVDIFIKFLENHKSDLEEIAGTKIDLSEIISQSRKQKIVNSFNEQLEKLDIKDNTGINEVVNIYTHLVAPSAIIAMCFAIVVLFVIIGLLCWSIKRYLMLLGIITIVSGSLSLFMYFALFFLSNFISTKLDITFDISGLLIISLIELVFGIVVLICRALLKKKIPDKTNGLVENM